MPGPAALIALAARLGIPKAASYTYKKLKKLVTKAQKKKKTKQTEAEKGYKGKGSKRKEQKVTQRKKDEKWNLGVRGRTQIGPSSLGISQSLK